MAGKRQRGDRVFVVGARGIPDVEGGVEKNSERLFPLLVERGWDVTLVGLKQYIRSDSYKGVKLEAVPDSRILNTDKLAGYLAAIKGAVRHRADVVHMQGLGSALFLFAYKAMGKKTIVRYGSADYTLEKWGFVGRTGFRLAEMQLRMADAVIAVGSAMAETLKERGIHRNVHIVPNGVDEPDPDAKGAELPERPFFLAVGRLTTQKNFPALIRAFNRFAERHPEPILAIAGGMDEPKAFAAIEPLVGERVRLLGRLPRSSLGALYANAIGYISASHHEGLSNAVLEAIGHGAPVALSDIAPNRAFNLADRHYFDQTSEDEMTALFERMFADRTRFQVESGNFATWDQVADMTDAVYRSIGLAPAAPRA